ncbi:MAG: hypothetical protein ACLGXA_16735 [Acidobacteriota bacterium]
MPLWKRQSGRSSVLAALIFLSFWGLAPGRAQQAEPAADTPPAVHSQYLQLDSVQSSKLDAPTLSLLRAKHREIVSEAAFFGYNLNAGEWDYDAATCPAMPGQILLHYRRHYSNGAGSLFTAIVPKGSGRVWVVPVLYRNATPFRTATGSDRSIAVFNRLIPPDIATRAVQPEGNWLAFALCYADIVYGNANILSRAGTEMGLSHAPLPLLRVSEATSARSIVFTDRNAPGQYMVWNLTLSDKGQLVTATAQQLSDYVATVRNGAEPTEKALAPGKEPKVKNMPAPKEPTVVPRPQ